MRKTILILFLCSLSCGAYAAPHHFGGTQKQVINTVPHDTTTGVTNDSFFSTDKRDLSHAGTSIDLTGAYITYENEFNSPSLEASSSSNPKKWNWFTTPGGGYGHQTFVDGGNAATNVYTFLNGELTVTMSYSGSSWLSGQIYSATTSYYNPSKTGYGFAQKYGYFEARIASPLPATEDTVILWEGLWLKNTQSLFSNSPAYVEIDVPEIYSGDPNRIHLALHRWKGTSSGITNNLGFGCIVNKIGECDGSEVGSLTPFDGNFHTYGTLVTPTYIAYFYDRQELLRLPMIDEARHPFYMILDLALCDTTVGCPYSPSTTANKYTMKIDYVRVWQWPDFVGVD